MRIVDPQSATLTNIEVLSHLTTHPPRRPPNPPPNTNARNFVPSPDLRDHNTVVKEIHNYVSRLCGHLLSYPRFVPEGFSVEKAEEAASASASAGPNAQGGPAPVPVSVLSRRQLDEDTPMDTALRELIRRVQPFGLTKGEVLMIVNLGVGVGVGKSAEGTEGAEDAEEGEGEQMDVDQSALEHTDGQVNGVHDDAEAEGGEGQGEDQGDGQGEGEGEIPEEDYGALALLDTVIEEREERLSNEQVAQILTIIRETLGSGSGFGSEG